MSNTQNSLVFFVATCMPKTSIIKVCTEDEYWARGGPDMLPDCSWELVRVASREHMAAWVSAKSRWLVEAWGDLNRHYSLPDRSITEKQESLRIMRECEAIMKSLHIAP